MYRYCIRGSRFFKTKDFLRSLNSLSFLDLAVFYNFYTSYVMLTGIYFRDIFRLSVDYFAIPDLVVSRPPVAQPLNESAFHIINNEVPPCEHCHHPDDRCKSSQMGFQSHLSANSGFLNSIIGNPLRQGVPCSQQHRQWHHPRSDHEDLKNLERTDRKS